MRTKAIAVPTLETNTLSKKNKGDPSGVFSPATDENIP